MAGEGWDQDGNGMITLSPLVGCGTATAPDGTCMVRLEFVSSPDQPFDKPHALQLAMTRKQASELARALQRMAETPHVPDREKSRH
jgi:hypothetical protein